jgi:hypothetical protein
MDQIEDSHELIEREAVLAGPHHDNFSVSGSRARFDQQVAKGKSGLELH